MNIFKNQSGFALMEVVVAAGLLGVIAYLFMQMGDQVTRMDARIKDSMAINEIKAEVQTSFMDAFACERVMALPYSELKTNEKLKFPIEIGKLEGRFGNTVLVSGQKKGRIFIESITAKLDTSNIKKKNYENKIGTIIVEYRMKSSAKSAYSNVGKITLLGLVSKPITSSGPYLESCLSEKALLIKEVTDEVVMRTCASFGAPYDPNTGTCAINGISKLFDQTNLSKGGETSSNYSQKDLGADQMQQMKEMDELKKKAMEMMKEILKQK